MKHSVKGITSLFLTIATMTLTPYLTVSNVGAQTVVSGLERSNDWLSWKVDEDGIYRSSTQSDDGQFHLMVDYDEFNCNSLTRFLLVMDEPFKESSRHFTNALVKLDSGDLERVRIVIDLERGSTLGHFFIVKEGNYGKILNHIKNGRNISVRIFHPYDGSILYAHNFSLKGSSKAINRIASACQNGSLLTAQPKKSPETPNESARRNSTPNEKPATESVEGVDTPKPERGSAMPSFI